MLNDFLWKLIGNIAVIPVPIASHLADVHISELQTGMAKEAYIEIQDNTDGFPCHQFIIHHEPTAHFFQTLSPTSLQVLLFQWVSSLF